MADTDKLKSNTKKWKTYEHNPFTLESEDGKIKAEVDKDGKVKLTQNNIVDGEEVEDMIDTSAKFIYRLSKMLFATRQVKFKDEAFKSLEINNE